MVTNLTLGLASALSGSFAACATLILTQRWHGKLSLDHDVSGAQKIHATPVPRIGGLGLLFGLIIAALTGYISNGKTYPTTLHLLLCSAPVFLAGFTEDITKRVRIRTRLFASFVSAGVAIWFLDARLYSLDTPILDSLVSYPIVSVLFTIFAVGGFTHSINIIDGLNGLAAGTVSIILAGLASLAWAHGDIMVMKLCLVGIAAMGGFLILNYPFGRIFLGDGGAYLAGFWVAECGVLLLHRNPNISTWAVLLACIYPAWETVFSMYRRHVMLRVNSGHADLAHLHQLIYRNLRNLSQSHSQIRPAWFKHGVTSALIWSLTAVCQLMAIAAQNNSTFLFFGVLLFAIAYCWAYFTLAPAIEDRHQTIHTAKI